MLSSMNQNILGVIGTPTGIQFLSLNLLKMFHFSKDFMSTRDISKT